MNKHINHNLKLLTTWLRANKMSLNTSKTKILLLLYLNFRISGPYIPWKKQVKYMGLKMNKNLDWDLCFLDCQKITFIMLNRFCLLSKKKKKNSPVLKRQNQDGCNINQNQLKNTHLFHIVFEVLKVLLIKICQMQPLDILFLVVVC